MGDLTANFSAAEFKCPCGACDGGKMDPKFIEQLQQLREAVMISFKITSGFRCAAHNAAVGGKPDSMHLLGRAADIEVDSSWHRYMLICHACDLHPNFKGIGIAANYVHVDNRNWDNDFASEMWTYYK